MNIKIDFMGQNNYWENKINWSAQQTGVILSHPDFIAKVRGWAGFDFTEATPGGIADLLLLTKDVEIRVGFYSKWFTRAIAYEIPNGVFFNTRKESYGAGSPGNLAHELMHKLGFQHNGNAAAGNENTVPYRIGYWVDMVMEGEIVLAGFNPAA